MTVILIFYLLTSFLLKTKSMNILRYFNRAKCIHTTNLPPIPSQFCQPFSSDTTNIPLSYVSYTNILHIVICKYPILKTQTRAWWKPILSLALVCITQAHLCGPVSHWKEGSQVIQTLFLCSKCKNPL